MPSNGSPLEEEEDIWKFSFYRAENTLRLYYKDKPVDAVKR
jgi:hypothetical protein